MKAIVIGLAQLALTYLIVWKFGWTGLLISLPFFAVLPFVWGWLKAKWRRRNSLR